MLKHNLKTKLKDTISYKALEATEVGRSRNERNYTSFEGWCGRTGCGEIHTDAFSLQPVYQAEIHSSLLPLRVDNGTLQLRVET